MPKRRSTSTRKIPADSPLKRVAELQRGLNLADLKRHDEAIAQLKSLLDAAIPTTCAPIWRSAASMPRRKTIRSGRRRLRQGGRRA